jgi:hypothetical protein
LADEVPTGITEFTPNIEMEYLVDHIPSLVGIEMRFESKDNNGNKIMID